MFNRIDRYIAGLFWSYFFAGLAVFVTIYLAVDSMSMMVNYKDVAINVFGRYYIYSLPELIYRMVPVACVLSTVFTLSTINKSNELVALYSVGMSLFRIATPILVSVVLISAGVFHMSDRLLPQFTQQKNFVFFNEIEKNPSKYSVVRNQKIWFRSKDTIFNIKTLNDQTKKAQGLTMYYFNPQWDLIQMITARLVDLNDAKWVLYDGSVTLFTEDSSFPLTSDFKTKTISMGEDTKDLSSGSNAADVLNLKELSAYIDRNKEAGLDTLKYEIDFHSKFGFAFAALVMTLLGIPFSLSRARSGGIMLNIAICLGLVFLYWIFYSSALTLGYHGHLPPLLAAWTPNLVMATLATIFILKKK